jgi:hypothetical protein
MFKKVKITIPLFISFFSLHVLILHVGVSSENLEKKYSFNWEEVDGAVKYKVQIANQYNSVVLEEEVDSNSIKFAIAPGKYRVRVGAINKFNKLGSWSNWEDIDIATRRPIPFKRGKGLWGLGIKLGVGISYFQLQPEWNSIYQNSYSGAFVTIGYGLGNLPLFRSVGLTRFVGFEFETNYVQFQGKDDPDRIRSDLTNTFTGGNLYITTNFNFPLNIIIRGGIGVVITQQEYERLDGSGTDILSSRDPYYKAGFSVEYSLFPTLFLEGGIDYYTVGYLEENFKSLRYFSLVGLRL